MRSGHAREERDVLQGLPRGCGPGGDLKPTPDTGAPTPPPPMTNPMHPLKEPSMTAADPADLPHLAKASASQAMPGQGDSA